MDNLKNEISSMVEEAIDNYLQGESMSYAVRNLNWESMKHWQRENTDGPNGSRKTRFRRTKDQMERNLTREESFNEYNRTNKEKTHGNGI